MRRALTGSGYGAPLMEAPRPKSVKWVARATYGFLLLVLLAFAWVALRESSPEAAPELVSAPPQPVPSPARSAPAPLPSADEPSPEAQQPLPPAAIPPVTTRVAPMPRPPKQPVEPEALARESAVLERARVQVKSEPELALKTLAEREQDFPAGALKKDAALVQIEALLRLGRRPEAERVGRQLAANDRTTSRAIERLLNEVRPR